MALHFSEVAPDNTVQVTYIKYHEEDEETHDITEKEFETYILGLYDQLSSKNITTQSTQTTTTKTTPEVTTTAVTAKTGNPEQSEYYFGYLVFLKGIDRAVKEEHDNTGLINYRYYLYDINKDGFYELIVHIGESEGDSYILICTVDEENKDAFVEVSGLYGSHTSFIEKDGKLCTYFRSSGYQSVDAIRIVNEQGVWSVVQEKLFEQESSSEYKDYDTLLKGYDISDTDALEKICPPELLDEEYINSWVEKVVEEINDNF